MPLYEFQCVNDQCGKRFESLSKPYEPVTCPVCLHQGAERLITGFGGSFIKGDNSASTRPKGAGYRNGK